jgi:hypothetical protein
VNGSPQKKVVRQNRWISLILFTILKKKDKIETTVLCDSKPATQKIMSNGENKDLDFMLIVWVSRKTG